MSSKDSSTRKYLLFTFLAFLGLAVVKFSVAWKQEAFELLLGGLILISGIWGIVALKYWSEDGKVGLWTKIFLDFVSMFLAFVFYDIKIRGREHLLACLCPSDITTDTCETNNYLPYTCGGESQYFSSLIRAAPQIQDHECICRQDNLLHFSMRAPIFTSVDKSFAIQSKHDEMLFYISMATAALSVLMTFSAMFLLVIIDKEDKQRPLVAPLYIYDPTSSLQNNSKQLENSLMKRPLPAKQMSV